MQDDSRPSPPRRTRKPRAKAAKPATAAASVPSGEKRTGRSSSAAPTGAAGVAPAPSNGNPDPPPPAFDRLVADDGFVRDFDRLAANNPKSAVVSALAVGVAIGFVAGLLIARD